MSSTKGSNSGSVGRGHGGSGFTGFRFKRNEEDLLEEVLEDSEMPRRLSDRDHAASETVINDPLRQEMRETDSSSSLESNALDTTVSSITAASAIAPNTLQIPSTTASSTASPKIGSKMREHFAVIKSKIKSLDSDTLPPEAESNTTPTHTSTTTGMALGGAGPGVSDKSSAVSASPTTDKIGSFYRDIKTKMHEVSKKLEQKRAENRRKSGGSINSNSTVGSSTVADDDISIASSLSATIDKKTDKQKEKAAQEMKSVDKCSHLREDSEQDWVNLRVTPEPDVVRYTPNPDLSLTEPEIAEEALFLPQAEADVAGESSRTIDTTSVSRVEDESRSSSKSPSIFDEHPLAPLLNLFRNANISRAVTIAILALSVALVSPLPSFLNGLILGIALTIVGLIWMLVAFVDNYFTKIQATYDEKNIPLRVETIDAAVEYRPGSSLEYENIIDQRHNSVGSPNFSREVHSDWMHEFLGDYEARIADSEEDILGGASTETTTIEFKQDTKEIIIKPTTKSSKKDSDVKDGDEKGHATSKKKTQLVYVRLDGPMLRISKPKKSFRKVKEKDRSSNAILPHFIGQRVFDLSKKNTKIYLLLPKSIRARKKYLWIKKYPICIEQDNSLKLVRDDQTGEGFKLPETTKITLFVHNCRDKEVWFWRLLEATRQSFIQRPLKMGYLPAPELNSPSYGSTSTLVSHSGSGSNPRFGVIDHSHSVDDFCIPRNSSSMDANPFPPFSDFSHLAPSSRSIPATPTNPSIPSVMVDKTAVRGVPFLYDTFMARIIHNASLHSSPEVSIAQEFTGSGHTSSIGPEMSASGINSMSWMNAFMGRIFFDILSHPFWQRWIANKIQRKLARLKMPHFMPALAVTDISLGSNIPIFKSIKSEPKIDGRGLWVDLDMCYSGGFMMTLETKVDLIKFKQQGSGLHEMKPMGSSAGNASSQQATPSSTPTPSHPNDSPETGKSSVHNMANSYDLEFSESEDSDLMSESSEDESEEQASGIELEEASERAKQKVLKMLDKVAASPLFQQVTDTKYVREVLEKVSNCPLILTVQIQALDGVLTVNIPPPPTDRLWYAFRGKPNLVLSARPKFGDHHVSWTHMLEFIEKKLKEEFHDTLVMPNMDDLIIPALITTADQFIKVVP